MSLQYGTVRYQHRFVCHRVSPPTPYITARAPCFVAAPPEDILEHAELQEPSYDPTAALHLPFQTGPLPLEMDGEVPYEGLRQDLFHQEARGGRIEVGVENGATLRAGLSESDEAATVGAVGAAPRLDLLEKSTNTRHLLTDHQQQDDGQAASNGAVPGGAGAAGGAPSSAAAGGGGGGDADDAADGGTAAAAAPPHGKEPMQKSSSLTAKVFAIARTDRGSPGSGARFSAASAGTGAGMALSGGGGDHRASPDNLSPTSNTTSNDALPVRELAVRRQGDSSHLQKLFRTADDGTNCGSSSQPTSPSARALRREDGRSASSRSLRSASSAQAQVQAKAQAAVPSALAPGSAAGGASTTTTAAAAGTPATEGAPSANTGGGASRSSPLGPHGRGAAAVMPRFVSPNLDGGANGSGGPGTTLGGSWRGRKGPRGGGGVGARRDSTIEAGADLSGADQEGKMEVRDQGASSSNVVGDSKEELVPGNLT